mgnify:CR=1 FL=1
MPDFYADMRAHYHFILRGTRRITLCNQRRPNVLNIVTRMSFISKSFDNYEFNAYICKRIFILKYL